MAQTAHSDESTEHPDDDRVFEAARLIDSGDVAGGLFRLHALERSGHPDAGLMIASVYATGGPGVEQDIERAH